MKRVMLFIDQQNFSISMMALYRRHYHQAPKLDYSELSKRIMAKLPGDNELIKTYLFAPKPDAFLLQKEYYKNQYAWVSALKSTPYFTVVEGRHVARPVEGFSTKEMSIDNPSSYYVVEKGCDINMATHIISKGFLHAYDTAVILSGDSDYIPVLDMLNTMGKTCVVCGVVGQNMTRLRDHADDTIFLDMKFLDRCVRN